MTWKLTEDGKAYLDEDTGMEYAASPITNPYPMGFIRRLRFYLAWKLLGRDPTPPLHPDLGRARTH